MQTINPERMIYRALLMYRDDDQKYAHRNINSSYITDTRCSIVGDHYQLVGMYHVNDLENQARFEIDGANSLSLHIGSDLDVVTIDFVSGSIMTKSAVRECIDKAEDDSIDLYFEGTVNHALPSDVDVMSLVLTLNRIGRRWHPARVTINISKASMAKWTEYVMMKRDQHAFSAVHCPYCSCRSSH